MTCTRGDSRAAEQAGLGTRPHCANEWVRGVCEKVRVNYSGSVRRLIRNGVDTPLASLFVHTAWAMPEDAEGAARARSATEAFLYRRLDTLTETSGRFRLNVALPIPFDGFGTLEVDLLCAAARVVIELDGGQHLADPVAGLASLAGRRRPVNVAGDDRQKNR